MKLKTKIITLFCLIFFSTEIFAKDINIFDYPVQPADIEKIQKTIPNSRFLSGNFEQIKTLKDVNKKFIATGKFTFNKEAGYLEWNIQKPFSNNLVFTKDKLAKISNRNEDVITSQDQPIFGEISNIFQSVFSGDFNKMREYFQIFFFSNEKGWTIGLIPNSKIVKNVISSIILKGKENINEVLLIEEYGDQTLIKFKQVTNVKAK